MSTDNTEPVALPGDVLAMIYLHEADAVRDEGRDAVFRLHDCNGDYLFSITPNIDAFDLATLFALYNSRHATGVQEGRAAAYAAVRALIGVDKAIATALEGRSS